MLTALVLYLAIISLSTGAAVLSIGSAVRGFRRWGWRWRGRRSMANWSSVVTVYLGIYMLISYAGQFPVGNLLFGVMFGILLALLVSPLALRYEDRIDRGP